LNATTTIGLLELSVGSFTKCKGKGDPNLQQQLEVVAYKMKVESLTERERSRGGK
jgi:hypothetical protein